MGSPISITMLSGAKALELRNWVEVQKMLATAGNGIPIPVAIVKVVQGVVENTIENGSSSTKASLLTSTFIGTVNLLKPVLVNNSKNLYLSAMKYLENLVIPRIDNLERLKTVLNDSQEVQEQYEKVNAYLIPLIINFHETMQDQHVRLEQVRQLMTDKQKEAQKLQKILDLIKVEDIDAAMQNLMNRFNVIIENHENELPVVSAVLDNLQRAAKDLADTQALLESTKQEFQKVVDEIQILEMLFYIAVSEHDEKSKLLFQKAYAILQRRH